MKEPNPAALRTLPFVLLCLAFLWITHGIAYFAHEYAHSGTAWLLGWKANPFAIEYGRLSASNLLLFSDVDENVDYQNIFAHGSGHAAALIGIAGILFANGILYLLCRFFLRQPSVRSRASLYLFFFWLCFMCVANFYDYVPIRTFASHGDIAHLVQGLRISPWVCVVVLGYPTALAMWHFFTRVLPDGLLVFAPELHAAQVTVVLTCVVLMFGYFGASGYSGYGEVSHVLSGLSIAAIPGIILACWPRS
jgi:hypothetical protein